MNRLVALTLAVSAIGCSSDTTPPFGAHRSPIVFGGPSPSPSDDDAVLLLRAGPDGAKHLCSSALIAPNLVVTARHCVAYLTPGSFDCSREGELIENPSGGGQLGADETPENIEFHSGELPGAEPVAYGAEVISSLSPSICINDLAFVVLDRALDLPTKPIRLGAPTRRGEIVTIVGYGLTETTVPSWRDNPRRRKTGLEVVDVGPDTASEGVILTPPRKLRFEAVSACAGDSGGPALSEQSGAVIGVYSLASSFDCMQAGIVHLYTHVSPFGDLARQAFAAAGAEPVLEQSPDAGTGDAGDVDAAPDGASACDVATGCEAPSPAPARATDGSGCSLRGPARPEGRWLASALLLLAGLSAGRRAGRR